MSSNTSTTRSRGAPNAADRPSTTAFERTEQAIFDRHDIGILTLGILLGMETANEEAARRFAEAITSGDTEAAVAICDPEIVFDSVLGITGRPYRGHAGIRQYIADVKSAWAQWSVEVEDVVEGADGRVAITMTMHARGKESGALLHERAAHIWTLRDRRLVGNRPYRDPDDALRALGLASPRGRRGS